MSDKRYSKVEQEVIKILDEMEDAPKGDPPSNLIQFRPRPRPSRIAMPAKLKTRPAILERVRQYSAGSWLGVGIFALLLAWGLGRMSPILFYVAGAAALAAFAAALYVRKTGPRPTGIGPASGTKRWRGQDIDFTTPPSPGNRERDIRRFGRKR